MTPQEVLKQLRRNLDEDYMARPHSQTAHFPSDSDMSAAGLTKDSPLIEFMDKLTWGTRGGSDPLTYKRLRDCDTEHLQNILITQRQIPLMMSRAIIAILQERYIQELIWSKDVCPELKGKYPSTIWPNHCIKKGTNPLAERYWPYVAKKTNDVSIDGGDDSFSDILLREFAKKKSRPKRLRRLRARFWKLVNAL